jgi:hypothetical protein
VDRSFRAPTRSVHRPWLTARTRAHERHDPLNPYSGTSADPMTVFGQALAKSRTSPPARSVAPANSFGTGGTKDRGGGFSDAGEPRFDASEQPPPERALAFHLGVALHRVGRREAWMRTHGDYLAVALLRHLHSWSQCCLSIVRASSAGRAATAPSPFVHRTSRTYAMRHQACSRISTGASCVLAVWCALDRLSGSLPEARIYTQRDAH